VNNYIEVQTADGRFNAYLARPGHPACARHRRRAGDLRSQCGCARYLRRTRRGANASVVFYGGSTEKHLDEAPKIKNPLLIHLGEEDEYITKDAQAAIIAALTGNRLAQVYFYPGCCHALARHCGINFDKDAAELANRRTTEFFQLHLVQGAHRV